MAKKYRIIGGRRFYTKKKYAEEARRYNERVYYAPGYGYYIVRPRKSFWNSLFG